MDIPKRTLQDLADDVERAMEVFRAERLNESSELYDEYIEHYTSIFRETITRLPLLVSNRDSREIIAKIVEDEDTLTAFRFMAAPPISVDDLKTLASTTLSPTALRKSQEEARRVRDVVCQVIDPFRFPWVRESRAATESEIERAVSISAALVAVRKVETARRKDAKDIQESRVKTQLANSGLKEVTSRNISQLDEAPAPGEFCGESKFGSTRADVVVRLWDGRVMPIECKASNSAVNSFKRINHEALNKARGWLAGFGEAVVPAAVISGVFKASDLKAAQDSGLLLFWAHRLSELTDVVESSKPG